jgi:hypothetical protein
MLTTTCFSYLRKYFFHHHETQIFNLQQPCYSASLILLKNFHIIICYTQIELLLVNSKLHKSWGPNDYHTTLDAHISHQATHM